MSDQSDSQNRSEEQVHLSEGTSPSSSSDDGSRSTPSNLPKAATRTRKKKTSESEDEDYVAVEDEATSKKKVVKKEYSTAAAIKPGMKQKVLGNVAGIQNFLRITKINLWSNLATREGECIYIPL